MPTLTKSQIDAYYLELYYETGECLIWTGCKNRDGYGKISRNGQERLVHRLAWEDANGPIPEGMVIRHRCDNPSCHRADHLLLGTHADNVRDRVERAGRKSKLSADEVAVAKALHSCGAKAVFLAKALGVSPATMHRYLNGESTPTVAVKRSPLPVLRDKKGRPRALSAEQVEEMKALRAQGILAPELAERFSVSVPTAFRYLAQ